MVSLANLVMVLAAMTGRYVALAGPAEDCLAYLDYSKASQCLERDLGNTNCINALRGYHDPTKGMKESYETAQKCLQDVKNGKMKDKGAVDCLPNYMKKSEDYKALVKCTLKRIAKCTFPKGYKACSDHYMPDPSVLADVMTADICLEKAIRECKKMPASQKSPKGEQHDEL